MGTKRARHVAETSADTDVVLSVSVLPAAEILRASIGYREDAEQPDACGHKSPIYQGIDGGLVSVVTEH